MRICGQHRLERNALNIVRGGNAVAKEAPKLGDRRGSPELLQLETKKCHCTKLRTFKEG